MAIYSSPGSAKPEVYSFSNSTQVTITHNLGYKPMIEIILSDGSIAEGQVTHQSLNQVVISFQISLSGEVLLR